MKKSLLLFFAVLLISANISFAQSTNNIQTDYINLHQYIGKKTYSDFLEMYQKPTNIQVSSNNSFLVYEFEKQVYRLFFDGNKGLSRVYISFSDKENNLDAFFEEAAAFSNIQSKKELQSKLGAPSEIMISGKNESWTYNISENEKVQMLRVQFDNDKNEIIAFDFNSNINNEQTAIDLSILSLLKEGETLAKDVKKALGLPSYCSINTQAERWSYQTDKAQLILYFDNNSILKNYSYNEVDK